jgi:hypothetical protein
MVQYRCSREPGNRSQGSLTARGGYSGERVRMGYHWLEPREVYVYLYLSPRPCGDSLVTPIVGIQVVLGDPGGWATLRGPPGGGQPVLPNYEGNHVWDSALTPHTW